MHNIGFESYQDSRLIPPDCPHEAVETERERLIEKYLPLLLAESDPDDLDGATQDELECWALDFAAEHGEKPEHALGISYAQWRGDYDW